MRAWEDEATLGGVFEALAERLPEKVALRDGEGKSVTFSGLNARVDRLNAAVEALGVRKGARVAILSHNRVEFVEVFGLAKTGLVMVPLNWRLGQDELLSLLLHCSPELIFVDQKCLGLLTPIRSKLSSVKALVGFDGEGEGLLGYEKFLAEVADRASFADVAPTDPVCIVYTSGTTGAPKGVTLSHLGVLGNMRTAAGPLMGLTEQDRAVSVMPFFHVGGLWYYLFPVLAAGCTVTVLPEFEPESLIKVLDEERATVIHLVPTMVGALIQDPGLAAADLSHLKTVFYAASPIPSVLLRQAMELLPACAFVQSYGSTEAGIVSCLDPDDHVRANQIGNERLLESCGRALGACKVRVTHEGAACEPGQVGEIEVNNPYRMDGYWLDPDSKGNLTGGWVRTGDLGYLDDDEYLFLVDRKNDMIVTGGENVFPSEVEQHLLKIPGIAEAAVFGLPDPRWIERVVAAVVLTPGGSVSPADITANLREKLARYKCPKDIIIVDNLPKNSVGKVLRKVLREIYTNVTA